jgi:phosphatidylserine/phosphatidylglycerophosphate/cardiolipin synthase-like enzyme
VTKSFAEKKKLLILNANIIQHYLQKKVFDMKKSLLLIALICFFAGSAFAQQANHVVISEVFYLGAINGEFVELYNPTGSDILLTGITLQSGSGIPGSNTGDWTVDLNGKTIKAHGFLLIGGSLITTPVPDALISAGKELKNSGTRAGVRLNNTTNSTVIDGIGWDATAVNFIEGTANISAGTTSSSPKSLERKALSSSTQGSMSAEDADFGNGYDSNDNSIDFVLRIVPQPQNSASPTEQTSSGPDVIPPSILVLKTPSATQIDLTFNEAVDSVTSSTSTNYTLDKSATVSLTVRNSTNPSKVSLTVSTMTNGIYTLTIQNVKDTSGNIISTPITLKFCYGSVKISDARALGVGSAVRVSGVITVANEFAGPPAYIQDSTGGVAVFNYNFVTSAKVGDIWEVGGTLKDFNGLLEIDPLTDSVKISSNNPRPAPKQLNSTVLNESVESQIVRVNKVMFAASGLFATGVDSAYEAGDAFGPLIVYVSKGSNIVGSSIPADSVNLIGIVNERNGVYRLLPRSLADINVIDPPSSQTWLDINIARSHADGDTVKVRGVVTYAQPSKTAAKTIFLQDFSGGIAVYDQKTDTLLLGDSVEVKGVLKQYSNLLELSPVDSVWLLTRGLPLPAPKIVTLAQASEAYESQLVKIYGVRFVESGTFTGGTNGTTYNVTDGSTQLNVRIPFGSALDLQLIPVGLLDIVGVLGQYTTAYQVIPRTSGDLIVYPGPQITSMPAITSLTDSSFTINWSTYFNGNSIVYFGPTINLGDSVVVTEQTTNHSVTVSGLKPGRIYYYRVFSANELGTAASFITPQVTTSSASSGQIKVYFNYSVDATLGLIPLANGNTDLLGKLLERIHNATQSIDMAVYSYDDFAGTSGIVSDRISDSLIAARSRGVKIRVVFDNKTTSAPLSRLEAAGISVMKRNVPGIDGGIMHNKIFIFDGRDTTDATDDWVIMGSWNVTNDGTRKDAQNAVFIQDQSLARIYTVEFEEMFGSSTETKNPAEAHFGPLKSDNTPHVTYIGGTKIESYFSPSDRTTSGIIRALSSADNDIFFGVMSFTRTDIAQTLITKKNAGIHVRGIINDQSGSVLGTLQSAGVDAFVAKHDTVKGIFHHKYAVIDPFNDNSDPMVITGSHNWSTNAETDNDENTLIIHSGEIARQYTQEFIKRYKESGGTGMLVSSINSTVPGRFELSQNYPNPFNPTTEIQFQIPKSGLVSIKVFDILGRQVTTLLNEIKQAGYYKLTWNASSLPTGVYFYQVQAGNYFGVKKTLLLK